MPTTDERREVAEIMRDGTRFSVSSCAVAPRLGLDCEEFETCAECESMLADCLADLIEPEPERTCQMEYDESNSGDELYPTEAYRCSACRWITVDGKPNYCPNCGAKVVE